MRLYPAVDIRGGKCVRLRKGSFDEVTAYGDDPAAMAVRWQNEGAEYLHIVNLDGALGETSVNRGVIRSLKEVLSIPYEVGGGIRSLADIEDHLDGGADRVIIGTRAAEDPDFARRAVESFGAERIVVGIDARGDRVSVRGWKDDAPYRVPELAQVMKDCGVRTIIYTDIERDGMLCGPNIEMTGKLAGLTSMEIIASGGISSEDDLRELSLAGIPGAVLGKSLYEGRISLVSALHMLQDLERKTL